MSISALTTAAQGLIDSERRATDAARRIVLNGARSLDIASDARDPSGSTPNRVAIENATAQDRPNGNPLAGAEGGSLIQDIVNLRTEQRVFEANAAVFRRADEVADEVGRLLDDEG